MAPSDRRTAPEGVVADKGPPGPCRISALPTAAVAAAFALPWLLVPQGLPWPSFVAEAAAALAGLVAAAVTLAAVRPRRWRWPPSATFFLALAGVVVAQGLAGPLSGFGEAVVPLLYLLAMAGAALLGANAVAPSAAGAASGPGCDDRVIAGLMAGLMAAGTVSTGLALAQMLKVDGGVLWPSLTAGQRPLANVGQPNLLALLLVWAVAATGWAWSARRLGGAAAVLLVSWFVLGVLLTQSRSGLLALLLVLAAALASRRLPGAAPRPVPVALVFGVAAGVLLLWWAWPHLFDPQWSQAARSGADTLDVGKRPAIWRLMWDAAAERPLSGYGWGKGVEANWALEDGLPALYVVVGHAHNLVLDLAVWSGWPVALAATLAMVRWTWRRWRGVGAVEWPWLAMLGAFAVQALLELPHAYLTVVVPVAMLAGALDGRRGRPLAPAPGGRSAEPGRAAPATAAAGVVGLAALWAMVVVDYARIAEDHQAWRVRSARIGDLSPPPRPEVVLLADLQRSLEGLRVEAREGLDAEELERLEASARRFPGAGTLYATAQALALNGDPQRAQALLHALCQFHRPEACDGARRAWEASAAASVPFEP